MIGVRNININIPKMEIFKNTSGRINAMKISAIMAAIEKIKKRHPKFIKCGFLGVQTLAPLPSGSSNIIMRLSPHLLYENLRRIVAWIPRN
jgi:hypothetical protein